LETKKSLLVSCAAVITLFGQVTFGETMNKAGFWEIIESAKLASPSKDERPEALRAVLEKLSPDEIKSFHEAYLGLVSTAYTWPLWGAAYVMNGGCSDDCFDYFRDWLISEGQSVYEAALKDPETLAQLPRIDVIELEEFRYVADKVYEDKAGRAMESTYPPFPSEPAGDSWDEDTVDKLFPKLAAMYW
jgi:hypothetical protein